MTAYEVVARLLFPYAALLLTAVTVALWVRVAAWRELAVMRADTQPTPENPPSLWREEE